MTSSWWVDVPREAWREAVAAEVPRMEAAKPVRVTSEDARRPHRKFDQGSTFIVRTGGEQ